MLTPPASDIGTKTAPSTSDGDEEEFNELLTRATHVLATEAAALANITRLYTTDRLAQHGLRDAVEAVAQAQSRGGKLVACGVGKSAYIAQKFTATCKSLSVRATFLHACEAVHGDIGDVSEEDVLLFISYSGKTPELLNLLPHLPESTRLLAISGYERAGNCPLLEGQENGILLPAPIPELEEHTFGVSAPTTSTTVALAVADMLALTIAEKLHRSRAGMNDIFRCNHPGGAIGLNYRNAKKRKREGDDIVVLELPSPSVSSTNDGC